MTTLSIRKDSIIDWDKGIIIVPYCNPIDIDEVALELNGWKTK